MFGHIGEFVKSDKPVWGEWCKRLGQYFLASKLEDDAVKRAVFLFSFVVATYNIVFPLQSKEAEGIVYHTVVGSATL